MLFADEADDGTDDGDDCDDDDDDDGDDRSQTMLQRLFGLRFKQSSSKSTSYLCAALSFQAGTS